jgi:hypothetical protein
MPKGVVGIRKSKMDRQHNGQTEKRQKKNNYLQSITHTTKDLVTQTPLKRGWTQVLRKGKQFLIHEWHPSSYTLYIDTMKRDSVINESVDIKFSTHDAFLE